MAKIKDYSTIIGTTTFLIGLGGLAGACEGQGSFLISSIIFSIGFGLCLVGYKK